MPARSSPIPSAWRRVSGASIISRSRGLASRFDPSAWERLMNGLRALADEFQIPLRPQGPGLVFHTVMLKSGATEGRVLDHRDYVARHDAPRWAHLRRCLLEEGVRVIERGLWFVCLSTPATRSMRLWPKPGSLSCGMSRSEMKVFLAGLFHETNTFAGRPPGWRIFDQPGQELLLQLGNGSPMDGFLSAAAGYGWDVVPGIDCRAHPSGMPDDEVFEVIGRNCFLCFPPRSRMVWTRFSLSSMGRWRLLAIRMSKESCWKGFARFRGG